MAKRDIQGVKYPGGEAIRKMRKSYKTNKVAGRLQAELHQRGLFDGDHDKVWSLKLKRAVKEFQRKKGLTVDGIPGEATWKALGWPVPFVGSGDKNYPYIWRRPGVNLPNAALCKALNALGKDLYEQHGKRFVMVSGQRTMAQQRALYDGWIHRRPGFNLAAVPNPNAPHIRNGGSAADCGVEDKQGGNYISILAYGPARALVAKHGLFQQVQSELWHLALRSQW